MKWKTILTEKANGRVKKAFRRKKSLFATVELRIMAVKLNFNFLLFDSNVVDSVWVVKMMRKIVSIVFFSHIEHASYGCSSRLLDISSKKSLSDAPLAPKVGAWRVHFKSFFWGWGHGKHCEYLPNAIPSKNRTMKATIENWAETAMVYSNHCNGVLQPLQWCTPTTAMAYCNHCKGV